METVDRQWLRAVALEEPAVMNGLLSLATRKRVIGDDELSQFTRKLGSYMKKLIDTQRYLFLNGKWPRAYYHLEWANMAQHCVSKIALQAKKWHETGRLSDPAHPSYIHEPVRVIFRTIHHVVIDCVKAATRGGFENDLPLEAPIPGTEGLTVADCMADPVNNLLEEVEKYEEREFLGWFITQLPDCDRRLLRLHHQGLSFREIAAQLGKDQSTHSRRFRQLASEIRRAWHEDDWHPQRRQPRADARKE